MTYSTTDFFTCEFLFATDMINLHDNIMLFKSSSALDDIMEPDGEVMIRFIDEELLIFGRFAEDGECHFVVDRLDGPAIVIDENNYAWISNDDKHRTDGPATIWGKYSMSCYEDREEYWIEGNKVSPLLTKRLFFRKKEIVYFEKDFFLQKNKKLV